MKLFIESNMPHPTDEQLQPFYELNAGAGAPADPTILKLFRDAISDSAITSFLDYGRDCLYFDKDITANDLVTPLMRGQWPVAKLREIVWAINEVILRYKSANEGGPIVYAYLGVLYVYCQVRAQDVDDTHIGAAAAAIIEGTSGTSLGIQIQVLHLLSWAVTDIRRISQRTYDPRAILCYTGTVLLVRLVRMCARSTELMLLESAVADQFQSQPRILSEFLDEHVDVLISVGRDAFLGDDGVLSVLRSFSQTCFFPANPEGE
jgi:hypothetical protein